MRLPITPQISTKDGVSAKNARLTNCLKESKKGGDKAVVRPGLSLDAQASGVGNGLVVFNNELVSVYGATLGVGLVETSFSASLVSYTPITTRSFYRMAHNGTMYVAAGRSTSSDIARIYTSSDGETWTNRTIPATGTYYTASGVIWSGSFWLVSMDDDDTGEVAVLKSSDGITWVAYLTGGTALVTDCSLGQGGGYFYICVDSEFFRSSDGESWAFTDSAIGTLGIAYGLGLVVTVGFGGPAIASVSDDDGVSFSDIIPTAGQSFTVVTDILFDGTQFVAISGTGSGTGASILVATTGFDMEEVAVLTTFADGLNRISFDGTTYVATSSNGAYAISTDLETWTEYSEPTLSFSAICSGATELNFFAEGTPGLISIASDETTIPALATITGDYYDFAQSPL